MSLTSRLSFRCEKDLVERVDAARGLAPREAWLRLAVEQVLADGGPLVDNPHLKAPAGQPPRSSVVRPARSVAGPRREFRPSPKGKP